MMEMNEMKHNYDDMEYCMPSQRSMPEPQKVRDYLISKGNLELFKEFTPADKLDYLLDTPIMSEDFRQSIDKTAANLLTLKIQKDSLSTILNVTETAVDAIKLTTKAAALSIKKEVIINGLESEKRFWTSIRNVCNKVIKWCWLWRS